MIDDAFVKNFSQTINFRLAGSPWFEEHKKREPCLVYIKGERAATPCRQVATGLFYCDTSGGCYRFSSRMRRGVIVEVRLDDRIILDAHSSAITSQSAWDLILNKCNMRQLFVENQ